MEYLVVNSVGKYKTKYLDGLEYLVVPLRLIVPGILNGSQGPLLYTEEQNRKNYKDWDNIPLVAPTHPTVNSKPVSAKLPSIKLKYGIGHTKDTLVSNSGCLDSYGWFGVLLCNRVDKRIVPWIKAGELLELSTGLNAKQKLVENGKYKGTPYIAEVIDYKPDHVAILCDDIGACSVAMGCGVGIRNRFWRGEFPGVGLLVTNEHQDKKDPTMDKKGIWEKLGELVGITNSSAVINNEASYMDVVEALSQQLKEMYREQHKQDYPDMMSYEMPMLPYVVDLFSDSVVFTYCQSMWKLGYTTSANDTVILSTEDPIEVQRVTSYQEVADQVANSGKKLTDLTADDLWEPITNPYANEHAARIQSPDKFLKNTFRRKELGKGITAVMGKISAGGPMMIQSFRFDAKKFTPEEARKWMSSHHYNMMEFAAATNNSQSNEQVSNQGQTTNLESNPTQEGDILMPLTPEVRKTMLDGLIANCNCQHNVPWKGKDVNTLNSLTDDTLQAYDTWRKTLDTTPIAPAVTNQTSNQPANNQQGSFFKDAAGNNYLLNPITNQLVKVAGDVIQNTGNPSTSTNNQTPVQNTQGTQTNNTQSNQVSNPANVQEWLNKTFQNAPPEAAEIFNSMQEEALRQKASHVERLVGTLQGEAKDQAVTIYNAMSLAQLRVLVAGLPQQPQQSPNVVNWIGNAPAPIGGGVINEKVLATPKMDFKEIRNKRKQTTQAV